MTPSTTMATNDQVQAILSVNKTWARNPSSWSKPIRLAVAGMLLILVAAIDLLTGEELSFFVFYFVPVSFAAWNISLTSAVVTAFFATMGWLGVETLSGHEYSHPGLLLANALIRWLSYTLMGYFVESLKCSRTALAKYANELESRVAQRTAKLQERIGELEMFSYTVSHNLRAPLRAMEGRAHVLEEELPEHALNDEVQNQLKQIKSAASRMDRLIMDLVTYVQITISEPDTRPTYLAPVIADAIEANQVAITALKADVVVTTTAAAVWGNSRLLHLALCQILNNALKFATPGRKPVVSVGTNYVSSNEVRIWVKDNGIGIPAPHQVKIFGLFERLHSQDAFGGGTGMGLAIASKCVEKMGGNIGVESCGAGLGATFWLILKAHQSTAKAERGC